MPCFQWLNMAAPGAAVDLRAVGWGLCQDDRCADCVTLVGAATLRLSQWRDLMRDAAQGLRRRALVLGVGEGHVRARLLALGFGDVVGPGEALSEIAVRASRIAAMADSLPRHQRHGPLVLDLLKREAFFDGRAVGLFPREFALLWRLMETPGLAVGKRDLLREIWHMRFLPETNSLAVHVSRLRAKLARVGLDGWVRSGPSGSYLLSALPPTCRVQSGRL
ncbi:MAG: winged helix-turn-helix domain-containing protein [Sphingomonadales bacterium]|nr:winged helix-turn-helix domain-containing protein [Sphingomonadales bacterium]MDE2168817.1 winged helix-turn-helix domain-containing protein [Sphingomonadales bacterium]